MLKYVQTNKKMLKGKLKMMNKKRLMAILAAGVLTATSFNTVMIKAESVSAEEAGMAVPADAAGMSVPADAAGAAVSADEAGAAVSEDEAGVAVSADEAGRRRGVAGSSTGFLRQGGPARRGRYHHGEDFPVSGYYVRNK